MTNTGGQSEERGTMAPSVGALVDDAAREQIRFSLDQSQIVEAAAGTGKTKVLVDRIVQIVVQGRGELRQMVVVTFTEKAAGELKLRIRQELERALQEKGGVVVGEKEQVSDGSLRAARLVEALKQLEEAHIGTIHGFSGDLLREYPVESGIDPAFSVLAADQQAKKVLDRVFWRWLRNMEAAPPPGLRRILRRKYFHFTKRSVLEELRRTAESMINNRDLDATYAEVDFELEQAVPPLLRQVKEASVALKNLEEDLGRPLVSCFPLTTLAEELDRVGEELDLEELEARLWDLPLQFSLPNLRRNGEVHGLAKAKLGRLTGSLKAFQAQSGAQLAALLQGELRELIEDYEQEKQSLGVVDFLDLLMGARDLLLRQRRVREEVQNRFSHVFVDEFQDTDPLQAEILLLIASDDADVEDWRSVHPKAGGLFVVGDPKQSIYRFRRADLSLYREIKERLGKFEDVHFLQLKTSFRALPEIQQAINATFSQVGRAQSEYMPLAAHRQNPVQHPALVALPLGVDTGNRIYPSELRREEPFVLAAWLDWLLRESGWHVMNKASQKLEPIRPHHISLLFKKMRAGKKDLTAPYVEEFQRRGLPVAVIGRASLNSREEIDALRTALRVIEWPTDTLSVYATLRGPLFGFDDRLLYQFSRAGGRFDAVFDGQPESSEEYRSVVAALKVLSELHLDRKAQPISLTIERLLSRTRSVVGFALRSDGRRALKSLNHLQQLARRFEANGGTSFRSFILELEEQLQTGGGAEEEVVEEGGGGIRLMTAHRAKGLEFPVVVLADAASRPGDWVGSLSDRHKGLFATELCGCRPVELKKGENAEQQELAEEALRLLYVATTRARDLLIVPTPRRAGVYSGWLTPLEPALHGGERLPSGGNGLPAFFNAEHGPSLASGGGKMPGVYAHQMGAGESGYRVAWWDNADLPRRPANSKPLRFFETLKVDGKWADDSRKRYQRWLGDRDALIEKAHQPGFDLLSATTLAHAEGDTHSDDLQQITLEGRQEFRDPVSEDGRPYGILVHGILEHLDFARGVQDDNYLIEVAQALGGELGTSEADVARAIDDIRQALGHPLLKRAAEADHVVKEMPLTLCVEDSYPRKIVEGIVDLVFVEGDRAVVIDYKTDASPNDEALRAYRQQVGLYLRAIAEATGMQVEGHLFLV
jgi:ATP-dependent helicase/nuclease subunit A